MGVADPLTVSGAWAMPLTIPIVACKESNMNALDEKTTQVVWEILNAALYDLTQGKKDDGITAIEEAIKLIEGETT